MLSTEQLSFSFGPTGRSPPTLPVPPPVLALIRQRLLALYGPQRIVERSDPVDQLVNAMLSSQTRDELSFPAFKRAWHYYKSWDALSRAPFNEIKTIIRAVTHAEKKAEQIPRALRMIEAETGSLDLMFLRSWPEGKAMAWLMTLPGVGPKVAATVSFSISGARYFASLSAAVARASAAPAC